MNLKYLKNVFFGISAFAAISLLASMLSIQPAIASYTLVTTIKPQQVNALGIPASWNAATNTPTIASGVAYAPTNSLTVTTGGTINLNVNNCACSTVFAAGDLVYFDGTYWQQISSAGGSGVPSVNGITTALNIVAGSNVTVSTAGSSVTVAATAATAQPTAQGTISLIYPASGVASSSTAGAVTLATALPNTIATSYIYLPSSAVNATQTAGFYYCVGSSSTLAQCYNNTYAASGVAASIPATPTAFTTANVAGTGFANALNTYVTFASVNIPANTLGARGSITTKIEFASNNSSNAKTCGWVYGATGGTPSLSNGNTTSVNTTYFLSTLYSNGSPTVQKYTTENPSAAYAQYTLAVNSALAQPFSITCQLAATGTTDWVMIQQYSINATGAP